VAAQVALGTRHLVAAVADEGEKGVVVAVAARGREELAHAVVQAQLHQDRVRLRFLFAPQRLVVRLLVL